MSHTNVLVTGSASVNFGAQAMANVLPSSPPPLIQAPPETSPEVPLESLNHPERKIMTIS